MTPEELLHHCGIVDNGDTRCHADRILALIRQQVTAVRAANPYHGSRWRTWDSACRAIDKLLGGE